MDKWMKIAVMLTAVDNMSAVVQNATDKAQKALNSMSGAMVGQMFMDTGKAGLAAIDKTINASGNLQEAGAKLKAVMMGKDGIFSQDTYNQIEKSTQQWSDKYANTQTAYIDMVKTLKANRINEKDILGGVGESAAQLADYFDQMNPASIGLFAARMKNDFGITAKEMPEMMDFLARMKDSGVGLGSEDSVNQMTEFFAKASLGLANLKTLGLQSAKELGAIGGYFISRGLGGATVGTNLRRIEDTIRSPEKLAEITEAAKKYGVALKFFDGNKFLGIKNLVTEFSKLKGLDPTKISEITKPFGGKMGLSTDFVDFISNYGTDKFKEFVDDEERQAKLITKLGPIMDSYNYQQKVMDTNLTNLEATMGKSLLPLYTWFMEKLTNVITGLNNFFERNPLLGKAIMYTALATSALAISFGAMLTVMAGSRMLVAISGIRNITTALAALDIAALANPYVLITVAVIALAGALTYCYFSVPAFKTGLEEIATVAKNVAKIFEGLFDIMQGTFSFDSSKIAQGIAKLSSASSVLGFGGPSYGSLMQKTAAATSVHTASRWQGSVLAGGGGRLIGGDLAVKNGSSQTHTTIAPVFDSSKIAQGIAKLSSASSVLGFGGPSYGSLMQKTAAATSVHTASRWQGSVLAGGGGRLIGGDLAVKNGSSQTHTTIAPVFNINGANGDTKQITDSIMGQMETLMKKYTQNQARVSIR